MTFRNLLGLKAIACGIGAPILLLIPQRFFPWIGVALGAGGAFPARAYGAALAGTFFLTWFARDVRAGDARRAILLHLLVYDALGAVVTLAAAVAGALNPFGWGIFLAYAFFAAVSAWLLSKEPLLRAAGAPAPPPGAVR